MAARLYRSFATVGGLTAISRVAGFFRDIQIANVLGSGPVADAFFVAFRLPNLFRSLFAEGAFNSAFVPQFAKLMQSDGTPAAKRFAEEALAVLAGALLIITIIAELAMPWLVRAIAPGFAGDAVKFDLAVAMTRITFPYLLCMSVVALSAGILNALGRFSAAAAAPILLNIVMSAMLLGAAWLGFHERAEAGLMLAWGVLLAGFAQLYWLSYALRRQGFDLALRLPRLTDGVRRLFKLGLPGVITAGITQINILIGTMIASLQEGAVSWLYYADRVNQLPLGIVGIAISVVLLPELTRQLAQADDAPAMNTHNRALEFAMLLTLPAAVALVVAAQPIVAVLFERGAFSAGDTQAVAAALAMLATGLPAYVLIKVLLPGFFAREDTRTPMLFAGAAVAVNVALSALLFAKLGHIGIALATTVAAWLNAVLLGATLLRHGALRLDAAFLRRMPRIIAASLAMGGALWLAQSGLDGWLHHARFSRQAVALALLVAGGLLVYAASCLATGAVDRGMIARATRRG